LVREREQAIEGLDKSSFQAVERHMTWLDAHIRTAESERLRPSLWMLLKGPKRLEMGIRAEIQLEVYKGEKLALAALSDSSRKLNQLSKDREEKKALFTRASEALRRHGSWGVTH
jgi:hypothetical protein